MLVHYDVYVWRRARARARGARRARAAGGRLPVAARA
jgi:hypothetical protein